MTMSVRGIVKWTGRVVGGVSLLLIVVTAGVFIWLRTSLPMTDGTVSVRGLTAAVSIVRDQNAIPHIFASTERDAAFAIGYVHAQDRLVQMELMRRLGGGRLAEVFGKRALRLDRLMRTLGLYRRAEASFKHLSPETRAGLEAYSAGVNAFLRTHKGALQPALQVFPSRPAPWKPADSMVWGKLMAMQLAINWRSELLRTQIAKELGADKLAILWPADPPNGPVTITGRAPFGPSDRTIRRRAKLPTAAIPAKALLDAVPRGLFGGASNTWIIAGERTKSGKPILANDPHLNIGAPILWYLVRVQTPTLTLTGATTPGVPSLILGHNGHIAWGLTTSYADTDDIFIERLDPKDPGRYLTPNGSQRFKVRTETITVRWGDPVQLRMRETRHGPVLNDILPEKQRMSLPQGHVVALSAPWLTDRDTTPDAIYRLNHAKNWTELLSALRLWRAPPQNIAYADVGGTIGLYVPGDIPLRKTGTGFMPGQGWTGEFGWSGFIPFDQLPHVRNPASGIIVNANNRLVGSGYPHFISREWGDRFRAARIEKLLAGTAKHDMALSARIQADHVSEPANDLLPILLKAKGFKGETLAAVERLRAWDRRMDRNRPEPLIYAAWVRELNRALYQDELGELFASYWGVRPSVVEEILGRHRDWCDDRRTEARESCDNRIVYSLERALADLKRRHGGDQTRWRWGRAHYADLRHPVFGFVPVLGSLAGLRIANNGDGHTVNNASFSIRNETAPFAQRAGPGFRAIYDLAGLTRSRFMITTGQSGNPFSRHFGDLMKRWRDVQYVTINGSRRDVERSALGTLILKPAR